LKKAIVSVTNDLSTDQRVHKVCMFLVKSGFDVTLVGRKLKNSLPLEERPYKTRRFKLLATKGPFFYGFYNRRLLRYLMFHKADLLVSNDLDTLLPNYIASKLKGIPLVYDSHEYFCGVPELENRTFPRTVWRTIEGFIFPKLKYVYTVNDSIADLYKSEYHVDVKVVRNIPSYQPETILKSRSELGLPENIPLIIYQGAGINVHRGAEEAVQAMEYVDNAVLLIVGSGDVIGQLKEMAQKPELKDKIIFIDKLPFNQLKQFTMHASIGLTLDKDNSMNYRYSLPNKLFDYIHAGVPVLASPLIEVKKIIEKYNVGALIDNHNPKHIADKISAMLADKTQLETWKQNALKAAKELNWEEEEKELAKIYNSIKFK
jgi:glycosyltransferase involved in cell wall biosynthesis